MQSSIGGGAPAATRADIVKIFGNVEDDVAMDLLKLAPSVGELEEAFAWMAGQGDVLARAGKPQSAKVAAILDIVGSDGEEEDRL